MAKDRNTFAKRQREMDRKHKADQKRERRARKKQRADTSSSGVRATEAEPSSEPNDSSSALTAAELSVLDVFRRFRMSPGKMLCFTRSDAIAFRTPLTQLKNRGLLVAETFPDGYSLTPAGFVAIKDVPPTSR